MTRRRQLFVPIVTAALIFVAGCSGSSDDPEPTPAPTPSANESVDAGINPCELISAETLKKVNPREREPRAALMTGRPEFVGCLIGDAYDFSFGYRALASGPSLQEQVGPNATKAEDIGDEAFILKSEYSMVVGARFGDAEIIVRNDSTGNSDPAVRVDEKTMLAVVEELGKGLPDDLMTSLVPVAVGEGCLAADSKDVKALVGTVVLARGGTVDDATNCDYLGEDGSTIGLSRSDATNATDFLGKGDSSTTGPVKIDGVVKAELYAPPDGYSVELTIQPTKNEIAFVNVSRGVDTPDDNAERKFAKKDALALTKSFLNGSR